MVLAMVWLNTVGLPIFGFGATTTTSVVTGIGGVSALGFFVATVFSMCVIGLEFNLKFRFAQLHSSNGVVPIHAFVTRAADSMYRTKVNSNLSVVFHALCGALADTVAECQLFGDLAGARVIKCVHTFILLVFLPSCTQFLDCRGFSFLFANSAD